MGVSFSDESTRVYTGTVAILVESALPFTIGSMVYVITYGIGSDIAMAFSCYSMFTVRLWYLCCDYNACLRR